MTAATRHLRAIAERVADACVAQTQPRAILLTGSAGEGLADAHSDIDMAAYYDELPDDEQRRAMWTALGCDAVERDPNAPPGKPFAEEGIVEGVECELLFTTIAAWEARMADVLERCDMATPGQKALEGLLRGVPLHGADLIERWQRRAQDYPPGLAHAMVETHLNVYPIWEVRDWMAARDATIWRYQTLVESAQHILGMLAGVNRRYYTPFQLKRQRHFIDTLSIAPDNLAARLDGLFAVDFVTAATEVERLVAETLAIVEAELPEIDTSAARQQLGQRRQAPAPPDVR